MRQLVFATNNQHKIEEVNAVLDGSFIVKSLDAIGCHEELEETSDTLEGNALQKARYVNQHYGVDCFSEDTGLEVNALDGAPGVITARYAGPQRNPADNIALLLANLEDKSDRSARFRTIIALIINGNEYLFEGIVNGHIALEPSGSGGFGYDPVFVPEGYNAPFAVLTADVKNQISHRARAVAALTEFLSRL